jgi:hypothetical protein
VEIAAISSCRRVGGFAESSQPSPPLAGQDLQKIAEIFQQRSFTDQAAKPERPAMARLWLEIEDCRKRLFRDARKRNPFKIHGLMAYGHYARLGKKTMGE